MEESIIFSEAWRYFLSIIASVILIAGAARYIRSIAKRVVITRPLAWCSITLLMAATLYTQLMMIGFQPSLIVLASYVAACAMICLVSFFQKRYDDHAKPLEWIFLLWSVIAVCIYIVTKDVYAIMWCALCGHVFISVITFFNGSSATLLSQCSSMWCCTMIAQCLVIFTCIDQNYLYAIVPAYLLLFNAIMTVTTSRKILHKWRIKLIRKPKCQT